MPRAKPRPQANRSWTPRLSPSVARADSASTCGLIRSARAAISTLTPRSHHAAIALDAHLQHLARVALPPVVGGKDLDVDRRGIAGGLDQLAQAAQVDDAVAHHAAVEQQVCGRNEPV